MIWIVGMAVVVVALALPPRRVSGEAAEEQRQGWRLARERERHEARRR